MILVTGATGFVGRALVEYLESAAYDVRACSRQKSFVLSYGIKTYLIEGLSENTDWCDPLQEVDVVIHLAARVHVMNDTAMDPLAEFRKVNTAGTLKLARQAAEAGVKRFVFVSTIKVNGEITEVDVPFKSDDEVCPTDSYAISKYEAEQSLLALAKETGMEVVIIRPPLVYGAGVKANFAAMMKWMSIGLPLPFGGIYNQRSLVALDNLVSFIVHCIDHPKAANEVFLISDDEDVSTSELLQKVAKAFGKKALLLPVPVVLMTFVTLLLGKRDMSSRLFDSLQVNSSKACDLLDWKPVITMDEQLKKTAVAYLQEKTVLK